MPAGKQEEYKVWRTPREGVFSHDGENVKPPAGWVFIPAGDPGLTRRLKKSGDYWVLVHKRRNRIESLGLLTDGERVAAVKAELAAERDDPAYQKKLAAARAAREAKQDRYAVEFREAVIKFLNFAPRYHLVADYLADAVTDHAVPVGSGTVARTSMIPLEQRAEAAVIAWLRHQTTAYDTMTIARIKGERRRVRRELAEHSRKLLAYYRSGAAVDLARCPIARALNITEDDIRKDC